MDDIVRRAIAKWPDVPHCFGWLRLDARGHWRMRDERARQHALPGDRITHPALLAFINRNYAHDATGQWYFQNGPQRVYVDLELTPYIVRTDPAAGLLLHTGQLMPVPEAAWLTQGGRLLLLAGDIVAAVDDRDIAALLATITCAGAPVQDEMIMHWLSASQSDQRPGLVLRVEERDLLLQWTDDAQLSSQFRFVAHPHKPGTT